MTSRSSQEPLDFDLAGTTDGDILVVTFSGQSNESNARAMTQRYFQVVHASGRPKAVSYTHLTLPTN